MEGYAQTDLRNVPLGAVVRAPEGGAIGRNWVFLGWQVNTQRAEMVFAREVLPCDRNPMPFMYHASVTKTLLRKFPDLNKWM